MSTIIDLIAFEEGFRSKPYRDSLGYPTIGYGFKLGPKGASLGNYQLTIPQPVADVWLKYLTDELTADLIVDPNIGAAYRAVNGEARRAVLVSMAFQMGTYGLAKFRNTLELLSKQQYDKAAQAMLRSRWAGQTPARARRHAEQIRTGCWSSEYTK